MAKKWTLEEIQTLNKSAGDIPKIQGRSRGAVRLKMQEIGILKTVSKKWTKEENNLIKDYKPGDILPTVKNRSEQAIKRKLYKLGFRWPIKQKWSLQEISLLKNTVLQGKFPQIPGRSERAIRRKMAELHLVKNSRWTQSEIDDLKNGKVIPSRTEYAIKNQMLRLGLKRKHKPKRPWKSTDIEKLKELHASGYSAKQIHEMKIFDTGMFGIQHKLRRIGLVKGHKIKKLSKKTRSEFKKFLLNNYCGKTPKELMDIWNKQSKDQVSFNKVVYYLDLLNIKIPYYEVQKINNLRKKEKKIIEGSKVISSTIQTAIRAERIKLMQKRIQNNLDIWSGLKMSEEVNSDWDSELPA